MHFCRLAPVFSACDFCPLSHKLLAYLSSIVNMSDEFHPSRLLSCSVQQIWMFSYNKANTPHPSYCRNEYRSVGLGLTCRAKDWHESTFMYFSFRETFSWLCLLCGLFFPYWSELPFLLCANTRLVSGPVSGLPLHWSLHISQDLDHCLMYCSW